MCGQKDKVNCLIFDLDNTIYAEKDFYIKYLEFLANKLNFSYYKIKSKLIKNHFYKKKDPIKQILVSAKIYSINNHNIAFNLLKKFKPNISISIATKNLLIKLKKKKIKTGIITNGNVEVQKNKIKALKIKKYFNEIIYARECINEKPHPSSFKKILKLMNIKKKNTIFVGDTYSTDILGAGRIGLRTMYINNSKSYKKYVTYKISSLKNIIKII
jgi:putative hydrolase of the HAD superfamily